MGATLAVILLVSGIGCSPLPHYSPIERMERMDRLPKEESPFCRRKLVYLDLNKNGKYEVYKVFNTMGNMETLDQVVSIGRELTKDQILLCVSDRVDEVEFKSEYRPNMVGLLLDKR